MLEIANETYSALRGRFKGELMRPGHNGYEGARTIWNGMVAKKPGLIARCADTADVQNRGTDRLCHRSSHRSPVWWA